MQSGGSFEIDYVVMDPDDKILLEGTNERQGDYIFTANKVRFSLALASAPTFASSYSYVVVRVLIGEKRRLANTRFALRTRRLSLTNYWTLSA